MRLFWRALEALDYLLRQTRLCMLDMMCRPGRRRDQPQGAVPGRPPECRHAPITYVDHAAGHGAELFEKIWDIGAERTVSNRQQRFLCCRKRDNRRASA